MTPLTKPLSVKAKQNEAPTGPDVLGPTVRLCAPLHRHTSCADRHLQPPGAEPQCGQESQLQHSSRFLPMLSSKLYYGTIS